MKGIPAHSNLNVKNIHSAGIRSIPKAQRSVYLDLYVLAREKDRLEKDLYAIDRRNQTSKKQLEIISQRMEKLHEEIQQKENGHPLRKKAKRTLKTMSVNY